MNAGQTFYKVDTKYSRSELDYPKMWN